MMAKPRSPFHYSHMAQSYRAPIPSKWFGPLTRLSSYGFVWLNILQYLDHDSELDPNLMVEISEEPPAYDKCSTAPPMPHNVVQTCDAKTIDEDIFNRDLHNNQYHVVGSSAIQNRSMSQCVLNELEKKIAPLDISPMEQKSIVEKGQNKLDMTVKHATVSHNGVFSCSTSQLGHGMEGEGLKKNIGAQVSLLDGHEGNMVQMVSTLKDDLPSFGWLYTFKRQVASKKIVKNKDKDENMDRFNAPQTSSEKSFVSISKGTNGTSKIQLQESLASCEVDKDTTIMDNGDSCLDNDQNSSKVVVYEEKLEMCVSDPHSISSELMQPDIHDLDARHKVMKILQLFASSYKNLNKIHEVVKAIKRNPIYTKLGPIIGSIPGVEIGDEFYSRAEMSIVGLHRPYQAGIDSSKVSGVVVAISIVASGGYPDKFTSSDELIYTGSGGKATNKKEAGDQRLERGNLALKNCIEMKSLVRVIHGFKGQRRDEASHSKVKRTRLFIYDGLYTVTDCWQEGPKGSMVFKYKLQRILRQPELTNVHEGISLSDTSQGNERIPIRVINTIDNISLTSFKYIAKVIYPNWYKKELPKGCDCTNGCSDSGKCACAMKNGGQIPFNYDSKIIWVKSLVFECGPSCRCPPTCRNRVSQHGIKISLEIFRTSEKGWGVRSLNSISRGNFICEYTGELLHEEEAAKLENDEYLFDIGRNYHDKDLWKRLQQVNPSLQYAFPSSKEGFTIDGAKCGNVGKFINHSCSPNLYAQNVLWDHDDMRIPHIMFFATENIPPLQELTYDYHYEIGKVRDENGVEKVKRCFCGSTKCRGRLY
ncbi:hypothetical protein PR202_gb05390 [Eleusine coracana subsp. coracana]|uniref:Uncharacterized protein n=1 Tax=Eleusine coracana subsp. coracana TaxID=191504 RepID=A0AAV5E581_ELECO|nr:hypothetical protein PR202_gb05390 [Eleusine coracana subsp. coracana]